MPSQLRERYQVLKTRQELKFAALDCWKATAELMPENVQLDGFSFSDGRKLALNGTAAADKVNDVLEFYGAMRKATLKASPCSTRPARKKARNSAPASAPRHGGQLEFRAGTQTNGGRMKELLARFTAYFARLSSIERRFIVIAIVVGFVVVNLWFVFPASMTGARFATATKPRSPPAPNTKRRLRKPRPTPARSPNWKGKASPFRWKNSPSIFARPSTARPFKAGLPCLTPPAAGTDQPVFSRTVTRPHRSIYRGPVGGFPLQAGRRQFAHPVRALSLRPDAPRQALAGNLTLIASYQRKPSARSSAGTRSSGGGEDQQTAGARCAKPVTPTKKK